MPDSLERQLFSMVAAAHVASGGFIRISKPQGHWGVIYMGDDLLFMFSPVTRHGMGSEGEKHQYTTYGAPEEAVHAFVQHFTLMGVPEIKNIGPLDDTEFFFEGIHANVSVTWRHLKARFKGIKMILKRTDRRVMEDIIDEAASM